jgi:hypothetical protein
LSLGSASKTARAEGLTTMTVVISPNLRKELARIDVAGNIINPRTKEVVQEVEPEYVPPVIPVNPPVKPESSLSDVIEKKLNDKLEQLIEKRINEALEKLLK